MYMYHKSGNYVDVGGVKVRASTARDFIELFDASILSGSPMKVAFLNAHLANVTRRNPMLSSSFENFIILNDGVGTNIASWILYKSFFPENLNGTDLIPKLLTETKHSLRIFLLGAKHSAVTNAATALSQQWGRHTIVGFHQGYFDENEHHKIIDQIRSACPDILLVAMGNPKQELWIAKHIPDVCPRAFAVGAYFDFVSGEIPRAHQLLRRLNLEWLFRLWNEPVRLAGRYLVGIPSFLFHIVQYRMKRRSIRTPTTSLNRMKHIK
jgi:exopolysaccharide biosynthesis WecB/TagA/CpsF family protein